MKKKENKYCPMCGAELDLQPGPLHKEDGKTFCNTTHAYDYRMSHEPVSKQKQMGGI